MAITATEWLIISDVALEAAFRVDVPEPHRGRWVLSYLPTHRRLTRDQALAGIVLAEMILMGQHNPCHLDPDIARMYAAELDLTLVEVMTLLAVRGTPSQDPAQDAGVDPTTMTAA
ncbi:hypothetical protein [Nocardia cyriacigeorgica]|uniref:Uncharacterized protein n=1 Tax=Nocardia cyriacigeorgica TaxID=135487 RepID=A0A5R8NF93_9NOCA|nr:hypothetical protein [Nocardia cyriacigeorgica]TLF74338.1 hypothetical protein FEK34_23390 [Nocardia cyriacigeorgica]